MPSGVVAVTGGVAIDVSISVGAVVDVVVSPRVISGPSTTVPVGSGAPLKAIANAPIVTAALAPIAADSLLTCFDFTSDHSISVSGRPPHQRGGPLEQFMRSPKSTPPLLG
jgi:hypothetical protein